jgi:hypothetical protein
MDDFAIFNAGIYPDRIPNIIVIKTDIRKIEKFILSIKLSNH